MDQAEDPENHGRNGNQKTKQRKNAKVICCDCGGIFRKPFPEPLINSYNHSFLLKVVTALPAEGISLTNRHSAFRTKHLKITSSLPHLRKL
jgi:hypothetical protein